MMVREWKIIIKTDIGNDVVPSKKELSHLVENSGQVNSIPFVREHAKGLEIIGIHTLLALECIELRLCDFAIEFKTFKAEWKECKG